MRKHIPPIAYLIFVIIVLIMLVKHDRHIGRLEGRLSAMTGYPCGPILDEYGPMWPEIFLTGKANFQNTRKDSLRAIGLAIMGWAICMSDNRPPKNFGMGMAKISEFLGSSVLLKDLEKLANQKMGE